MLQEAKDVYKYSRPPKKYKIYFKKYSNVEQLCVQTKLFSPHFFCPSFFDFFGQLVEQSNIVLFKT